VGATRWLGEALMPDYDQGGHPLRISRVDLGPSVGWAETPYRSLLSIVMAGTYHIDAAINLVTVDTASLVTLILPSAQMSLAGPTAQPRLWLGPNIQFVDAGGFAGSFPVTIQPISGETIMGQAQIQITTNFGGLILMPISAQRMWVTVT
jgi:hypothetical protein